MDDYDIQLDVQGAGDEAVVLVPGMDGTGLLFYRQVPLLASRHRVATYALRNTATTMDDLVGDLDRVIDAVDPVGRRAIVVGESFGGALALSFALARPERVTALVVLNSFAHFAPQHRLHIAIHGLRAMPWGAMGLVRRATAFRMHSPHTHRSEIRRFLALTARASQAGYINRLRILTRYDLRERLHELRPPTLFLASERDHLVPAVSQARYMSERAPGGVMRILAGHGHVCLIAPDIDLAGIIHEWRSGISPGS